jgi:putative endonuclease
VNTSSAPHNQFLGLQGERIAEQWLTRKGWRVLQRRFRDGHRDIDLIAERDGTVAFIEVKARSGDQFGSPVAAVDWRKQREILRAARVWITRHGRPGEAYRFDVIGVLVTPRGAGIHCVENAFQAGM